MSNGDGESLDLTQESQDFQETESISIEPYDPRPQEDSARRRIAYILLGLLGFILIWALSTVTFSPDKADKIVDVLQLILSPMIALVSAATGFYFGSKEAK